MKRLNGTSAQSRSGGDGGMHTAGYDGSHGPFPPPPDTPADGCACGGGGMLVGATGVRVGGKGVAAGLGVSVGRGVAVGVVGLGVGTAVGVEVTVGEERSWAATVCGTPSAAAACSRARSDFA
ncbi:MAG: hypothetical protein ACKVT1_07350 [Dehalococcoidia bacterium]